jgi:uncharacterized protein (TIGR02453 family)
MTAGYRWPMATRARAAAAPAAFTGFPDEAMDFFEGLAAENSRSYWEDHREVYERSVREPMLALTAALEQEFGPAKMFRPHRDVRFSADKSPYKTHAGAVTVREGRAAVHYVQISAEGLTLAGGAYQLSPDQLARFRAAVLDGDTGPALAAIVAQLERAGCTLYGEQLKRAPRGVDPGHPRVELARRKAMAAGLTLGAPPWLATPDGVREVARAWRRFTPLMGWVDRHVGPPEPTEGDPAARPRR